MRVITWNINSVRARLALAQRVIEELQPDILCLQEIKCVEDQFPFKAFEALGYPHIALRGYKAYHGVAIISRLPLQNQRYILHSTVDDGRHIAADILTPSGDIISVDNYYIPAGGDIPDPLENPKFAHKLDYIQAMARHFDEEKGSDKRILVGDLNVAPHENDVWSHKQLLNVVSHTPVEVDNFTKMQAALPWDDTVRHHISVEEKLYSWWSYRARDWRASNRGRRLDHIWTSPALTAKLQSVEIIDHVRDWEKTSDHVPVIANFIL